jgi:hypothetical protein
MKLTIQVIGAAIVVGWATQAHAVTMTCKQAESQEIKSMKADEPASVTFQNSRSENVDVIWLNYQRAGQTYKTLGPGESYTQQTFMTHPWVFLDTVSKDCLGVYLPDAAQNTHIIR